jgi:arylsulfatase A-like enzyme
MRSNLRRHGRAAPVVAVAASVAVAVAAASLLACGAGESADPDGPPFDSVILISLDTVRADALGPWAPERRERTPEISRLGDEGVVFADTFSQAPSTAASHRSLFSSVYAKVHGLALRTSIRIELPSPVGVLARARGMRAAAFVGGGQLSPRYGFQDGFDEYRLVPEKPRAAPPGGLVTALRDAAIPWLREHGGEPFFLFLHTYQAHCPYDPPQPLRGERTDWYAGDVEPEGACGSRYYNYREMSEADYRYVRDLYWAEIELVDGLIGDLRRTLEEEGVAERTLIVLLSDHGESLGERGFVGHNRFWDEQLHVPLLFHGPGLAPRRIERPAELIDVMPTLFGLLGVAPPYAFQGRDLSAAVRGSAAAPPSETRLRFAHQAGTTMVEDGRYKLLVHDPAEERPPELFDRQRDPGERVDRWAEEPETAARLWHAYQEREATWDDLARAFHVSPPGRKRMDPETLERLRALGYVVD